jgi:hypothetical protein
MNHPGVAELLPLQSIYHHNLSIGLIELDIEIIKTSFADQRKFFSCFLLDEIQKRNDDLSDHLIFVLAIARRRKIFIGYFFAEVLDQNLDDFYSS